MERLLRVFLISHTAELYGAARSMLTLAEGLQFRSHVPLVSVPQAGPLSAALESRGIETVMLAAPQWAVPPNTTLRAKQWYLRQLTVTGKNAADLIRRFQPDVVHSNSAVIPSGALAARLTRVPHIWHLREQVEDDFDLRFILGRQLTVRLMGALSSSLIAISRSVARSYTAPATVRKLLVIYNGVELPHGFAADSADSAKDHGREPVLAMIGVLHPAKGQTEAIRALAILRGRGLPCRLKLIGADSGGYRPVLAALAQQLGVTSQITFHGHLPEPLAEMAKADIVLMCSRSEAFGRVTVEAMLLGRPVIGANTGGTPEIIEDGHTGLLYRLGEPDDLADKVSRLLNNPELAADLGNTARVVAATKFPTRTYVESVVQAYLKALQAPG